MDNKRMQPRLRLAMVVLILSSSSSALVRAQSSHIENSMLMVDGDESLLEDNPPKCPIGQECQDQPEVHTESDTAGTSQQNTSLLPRELLEDSLLKETKESNSGIRGVLFSNTEKTEQALNDAPLAVPDPGAGKRPSRSKGRSKADKKLSKDKKLKQKNRLKKCRDRRRKLKLERKMRKGRGGGGGGKGKIGRRGMAKRKGKKGKRNKRLKKCGKKGKRKGRKKGKNGRKRGNRKSSKKNGLDSTETTNDTLDSSFVGNFRGSGERNADTDSKIVGSDSSEAELQSVRKAKPIGASGVTGENVMDSNKGMPEEAGPSNTGETEFDAKQITVMFQDVFIQGDPGERKQVDLEKYVKAYRRLVSVFQFFGTVFSFAKSDLEDKINTLGELRRSSLKGPNPETYQTIENMFTYEFSKGIAKPGADATSGVRENAWIHRALKFIIAIMRAVADQNDQSSLSSRVKQFYTDILAPHHSWLVRMGVYAAIPMFPSRETLLTDMRIPDNAEGVRELLRLADSVEAVYDHVQFYYQKFQGPQ